MKQDEKRENVELKHAKKKKTEKVKREWYFTGSPDFDNLVENKGCRSSRNNNKNNKLKEEKK